MHCRKVVVPYIVICFLLWTFCFAQEGVHPKYFFQKETSLTYRANNKSVTIQEFLGNEQRSSSETSSLVSVKFEDVDENGNLVLVLDTDSLVISIQSLLVDSTFIDPAGMVGKRVRKIVAPNGDQLTSTDLDSFEVLPYILGFSSDREFLPNLPDEPMLPGQSISVADVDSNEVFDGLLVMKSTVEYKLISEEKKLERTCLKISMHDTFQLEGDGYVQGMRLSLEGSGDIDGTIYFAHQQGVLVESETVAKFEMVATLIGQENIIIPITQSIKSTLSLVE